MATTSSHSLAGLAADHRPYLLFGVQGPLEQFRLPEIDSVLQLFQIPHSWPTSPDPLRPYTLIGLRNDDDARKLGSRLVSVKHVWEYWASADSYHQVHDVVQSQECRAKWVSPARYPARSPAGELTLETVNRGRRAGTVRARRKVYLEVHNGGS